VGRHARWLTAGGAALAAGIAAWAVASGQAAAPERTTVAGSADAGIEAVSRASRTPAVFLFGDFGAPHPELARVGAAIRASVAHEPDGTIAVELGDNIYERGASADRAETRRQLEPILSALDLRGPAPASGETGPPLPLVVIPGNHDHDAGFGQTWQTSLESYGAIENEMLVPLDRPEWHYAPAHLDPSSDADCPVAEQLDLERLRAIRHAAVPGAGPGADGSSSEGIRAWACLTRPQRVAQSPPGLALIAVDSQVLIGLEHHHEDAAAAIQWRALDALLAAARAAGDVAVAIAHHPLESYGRHRPLQPGRLAFGPGWPQYTRSFDYALALPVVAQLTVLGWYASGWFNEQDVQAAGYFAYRRRMAEILVRHGVHLYAAGHDHSLSVMDLGRSQDLREIVGGEGKLYQLISGSTANVDPICDGAAVLYRHAGRGHARLTLDRSGAARLHLVVDPLDAAPAAFDLPAD